MKRRHPLITIGQIQMRLQRTSNRVLSKASISRILTNSIRLGKRAKRSDEEDGEDGINELMQLSSDEGIGGAVYIDDEGVDDEDEDDEILEQNSSVQNLDDFQRFMVRKTSVNEDESTGNEEISWNTKGIFKLIEKKIFSKKQNFLLEQSDKNDYHSTYPTLGSEDEDEVKEIYLKKN